jgi:hypothetical protein
MRWADRVARIVQAWHGGARDAMCPAQRSARASLCDDPPLIELGDLGLLKQR